MLRQLAQYHAKDPNNLFMVRLAQVKDRMLLLGVCRGDCLWGWSGDMKSWPWRKDVSLLWVLCLAGLGGVSSDVMHYHCLFFFQGLTHLGKGTLTLCPYHSDRQLMSQVAVAGLLTVLVSFLDVRNSELLSEILHCGHSDLSSPAKATLVV